MLKGIDPLLNGELLKILDEMGHGDVLLLVDRNFPAAASGRPVIRLGEASAVRAMNAILSVFPLDVYVETPLERMEVDDDPSIVTESQAAVLELAREAHPKPLEFGIVPRLEFYERAKKAYAVVHILETLPYSCFLLQKGVVFVDD
ncbi:RbsD/FucU family protein [Glaciibacter psychrotolerans]|uniref:L-fucose mutarotase n=1 Tax=Glaciibacter psychrotolerans TaxID=670054 RepID=A0A7Z0EFG0_9MICO|nr:RbsD/FucU domain-containing protein [Leifsonia psychrotolerans]NYJ20535.1 L-fucose mutarotase [Leifsonia psychrotolerans]